MIPEKLSTQELHYLINDHLQKDPRHALQELIKDRWGIGHDLQFPQGSIMVEIMGSYRNADKKRFKRLYRAFRKFTNQRNVKIALY